MKIAPHTPFRFLLLLFVVFISYSCHTPKGAASNASTTGVTFLSQPLVTNMYTADASAHVFNGQIYIYPSHDIEAGIPENDLGDHFDMRDYHVLSMNDINGKV